MIWMMTFHFNMKTYVRCYDRTVFEINPDTLEPKSCGSYDAYCFIDPEPDVIYIEHNDWVLLRNKQWDREMKVDHGYSRIGLNNI